MSTGDHNRDARRVAWIAFDLLVAMFLFRYAIVRDYHVTAVDGMQYHALSQELLHEGRYAFGPAPTALSFSRLPGYPLFLAYVVVRHYPTALAIHALKACTANVFLDCGSALMLFLALRSRRRAPSEGFVAIGLVALCPLMILLASHALTESFATFLDTAELCLAIRATRSRPLLHASLAGLAAGLTQLVRADGIVMLPASLVALAAVDTTRLRRAAAIAIFGAVAAALYLPWIVRNEVRFGAPYPAAAQWRTALRGTPLPDGPLRWARTWSTGDHSEDFLDRVFAFQGERDPRGLLRFIPAEYESPDEKQHVQDLFKRFAMQGLTPAIDAEFRELGRQRAARHPWQARLWLPLRRALAIWKPALKGDLSLGSPLVGQPQHRPEFNAFEDLHYALALLGALTLFLARGPRRDRLLGALLVGTLVLRSLLVGWTVPLSVSHRFLVEAMPLLCALGGVGAGTLGAGVRRVVSRRAALAGRA